MAILKGFPPSNTISPGPRIPIDPEPGPGKSYWERRKEYRKWTKGTIKELGIYFGHTFKEGEEEHLQDVSWACRQCFSDHMANTEVPWFLWEGFHIAVAMEPRYGAYYLKKWKWQDEDKWCLERRKNSEHMDPRVVAQLKKMGWDSLAHYKQNDKGEFVQIGETPLRPVNPEVKEAWKSQSNIIVINGPSKRALLEAIKKAQAKKKAQG